MITKRVPSRGGKCASTPPGDPSSRDVGGSSQNIRLERLREILVRRDERADDGVKLLLFSGGGFMPELRETAMERNDIGFIDLEHLYSGS